MRLTRIDDVDLNLFEFDYDLTFMVFFMDAEEKVYARYGGRDAKNADNRQSLAGLKYTMQSVLTAHREATKEFAPKSGTKAYTVRELQGGGGGRCLHCHQVKEVINRKVIADGEWSRDQVWRYPLPENLGFRLEVNRGNVVERVVPDTPAARVGLKPGDVVKQLGTTPIHSFGDAQYALDKAPITGTLPISWQRGAETKSGSITLAEEWRKTDVSWRPSMRRLIANSPLYGDDLKDDEKKSLGLSPKQLAFRQNDRARAREAGFLGGDIVLGIEGQKMEMDVTDFSRHIRSEYLAGDSIRIAVIRDGKTLTIPLVLKNR